MYTINVTLQFTLLTPGIAGSRYQLLFTIFCETIFFLEMSKVAVGNCNQQFCDENRYWSATQQQSLVVSTVKMIPSKTKTRVQKNYD